jgi:hypothetical protein
MSNNGGIVGMAILNRHSIPACKKAHLLGEKSRGVDIHASAVIQAKQTLNPGG